MSERPSLLRPVALPALCLILWATTPPLANAQPLPADTAAGSTAQASQRRPERTQPSHKPRHPRHARAAKASLTAYGQREDVMHFAEALAQAQQLDAAWVRRTLAGARRLPEVQRLIMPPPAGTAKNWAAYRDRFIEPRRIDAGAAFWRLHQRWLDAAESRYGVPPEIVVGIIGVETYFGRITGNFRVLDALATLAFDFPPGRKDRSAFFRDELGQFLAMADAQGRAPASILGSYAGAMGLGQFMPSSVRKYAVDFDGDGHVDITGGTGDTSSGTADTSDSAADVIGSIAHYLAEFGWKAGMPTHFEVRPPVDTAERAALLLPDILPTFSAAQMAERGAVLPDQAREHTGPLALVELQNGDAAPSHVAGTQNFYAVTRYNWSAYYALAVIELGQAIRARRAAGN